MTARMFLRYAGWKKEDQKRGLALLGQYLGKRLRYFISFPDAYVITPDGDLLEELPGEPAGFQEYATGY